MKYWTFLIVILFFSSCNNKNVNALKQEKIKFKDLPIEVTEYLKNPADYKNDINMMLLELPKGKESNYRLETVKMNSGPWVDHEKLINIKTGVYYKIDQGVPSPYIIFENKLYVPDRYNIFTTVDDLNSLRFTRYELR